MQTDYSFEVQPVITPKKNLVSIDIARAVAALGVFYYHLHIGALLAHYSGLALFNLTENFGATYAVPLFFLISGYCIHLSNLKYLNAGKPLPLKAYYKSRFLRIYPPYLAALLISTGVNFITNYDGRVSTQDFIVHLLMVQSFSTLYFNGINVVLWTVAVELAFYIIYPVFYYLRFRFSLSTAISFSLVVSLLSACYFSSKQPITIVDAFFFLNLWFAWCCGAFLADKNALNNTDLSRPVYKAAYALIVLAFLLLKNFYQPCLIILSIQINILIWTAPLVYLIGKENRLAKHRSFLLNIVVAIGLSSYSLYLFHEPLIAVKNFLVHTYLPPALQPAGVFAGIFFIPLITWFSYLYIEKPFIAKRN